MSAMTKVILNSTTEITKHEDSSIHLTHKKNHQVLCVMVNIFLCKFMLNKIIYDKIKGKYE